MFRRFVARRAPHYSVCYVSRARPNLVIPFPRTEFARRIVARKRQHKNSAIYTDVRASMGLTLKSKYRSCRVHPNYALPVAFVRISRFRF